MDILSERPEPTLCTCLQCGWVHFAVTREHAIQEVIKFNKYYDTLAPEQQQDYYGGKGSSIASYEGCFLCGVKTPGFRPYKEGDCPNGVTMQPVIWAPPEADVTEFSKLVEDPKGA